MNCGTGEDARWLASQGMQVLATDISAPMIEVAQCKLAGLPENRETATTLMFVVPN